MVMVNKHLLVICSSNSVGGSVMEKFRTEGWFVSHSSRTSDADHSHFTLDVRSNDSLNLFCESIKTGPKIDVLLLLCGFLGGKSLEDKIDSEIDVDFDINAIAQIKLIKRLLHHFSEDGRVIFLNSIASFNGSYDTTYAASKASIIGFVKAMAKQGPRNIRFNAIASGLIEDAGMASQFSSQDIERHESETPSGAHNKSAEIAGVIFDICGESWRNMNGHVIHINGGRYV